MNPILSIVSVRFKHLHLDPATGQVAKEFPSINKAKAYSKELGGSGKVRAFNKKDEAFDFIQEYKKAKGE